MEETGEDRLAPGARQRPSAVLVLAILALRLHIRCRAYAKFKLVN